MAVFGDNRGVERFVAVRFGDGYPVPHPVGIGGIEVRDYRVDAPAELLFALGRTLHDDADGEDVVHFVERYSRAFHLPPDGVDRFGASLDVVLDTLRVEPFPYRGDESCDEFVAFGRGLFQPAADVGVIFRFEVFQCDVLQFAFDGIESQFVGYLCVEVHALPTLLPLFPFGEHGERTHDLQPVGQLDEDDARVGGVGDDEVAEVVGLRHGHLGVYLRDEVEPFKDTDRDTAEPFLYLVGIGQSQSCHIVQQGGDGGIASEPYFGDDDFGRAYRVVEQRSSVVAHHAVEGGAGHLERFHDGLPALFVEGASEEVEEAGIPLRSLYCCCYRRCFGVFHTRV